MTLVRPSLCLLLLAVAVTSVLSSCASAVQTPGSAVPITPAVLPVGSDDTWTPGVGYTLVWADEFVGTGINTALWSYNCEANGNWSPTWNNEWQDYVDAGSGNNNAFVQDGVLVIRATRKGSATGARAYQSASLTTKGVGSWQYGKIAARMALPYGQGLWPAFWLLGNSGTWPASGEIDVMEMIGGETRNNTVYGTLHWADGTGAHAQAGGNTKVVTPQAYHVYEATWTSTQIQFAVDGTVYSTHDITAAERSEFHQKYYILLNLAVGGNWPGNPDASTIFPQQFLIDWVRVYQ